MWEMLALLDRSSTGSARRAIAALRSAGAVTPDAARDLRDFGVVADDSLHRAIREGRIRESTGGRFYVFDAERPSRRERRIKQFVFFALIVLIPLIEFWITGRRR